MPSRITNFININFCKLIGSLTATITGLEIWDFSEIHHLIYKIVTVLLFGIIGGFAGALGKWIFIKIKG